MKLLLVDDHPLFGVGSPSAPTTCPMCWWRARIRARFTRQMAALGARLEALAQHAAASLVCERVVEQRPLATDIYRRLITCLLAQGQQAEAYEVYRRCRQQLPVVLGIRPAVETDALVASLRNL